jgi:hypothetical protein
VNRLTEALENTTASSCASTTDWCQVFSYTGDGVGAFGNRTVSSNGSVVASPSPQTFSASTNRIADSGWSYDSRGNVAADPVPETYFYDGENRQLYYCANTTSACGSSNATTSYFYDGNGQRVQTQSSSGTTTFVYDAMGHVAAEYGYESSAFPCAETCYVNVDALGSTRMVTAKAATAWRGKTTLLSGN